MNNILLLILLGLCFAVPIGLLARRNRIRKERNEYSREELRRYTLRKKVVSVLYPPPIKSNGKPFQDAGIWEHYKR